MDLISKQIETILFERINIVNKAKHGKIVKKFVNSNKNISLNINSTRDIFYFFLIICQIRIKILLLFNNRCNILIKMYLYFFIVLYNLSQFFVKCKSIFIATILPDKIDAKRYLTI